MKKNKNTSPNLSISSRNVVNKFMTKFNLEWLLPTSKYDIQNVASQTGMRTM